MKLASRVIREFREEMVDKHVEICRQKIPSAKNLASSLVRDTLDVYLDELADTIEANTEIDSFSYSSFIGKTHGVQRAEFTEFTLTNVLQEYSILEEIIFSYLEKYSDPSADCQRMIRRVINLATWQAASNFTERRHQLQERKNLEEKEALTREVEELNRFVGRVAHDLRSPLATVQNLLELIEQEVSSLRRPEGESLVARAAEKTAFVIELIERLVTFARNTLAPIELTDVDVSLAVGMSTSNLEKQILINGAEVRYGELPTVKGDLYLITQVFQNLIENSLKYRGHEPPIIEIRTKKLNGFWKFCVADNGKGFSPEHAEKIFEMLWAEDNHSGIGTGIGLATCLKIVEAHGGEMWAEGEPNKGAHFYFTLPAAESTAENPVS